MSQDIWLSVEEVCALTSEVKETVRRKCKRGEYSCTFEKNGKYKNYLVNLDSLPEVAKNKYFGIKVNAQHSKFYKESPAWAKKQAKKYVELIELTKGMKHKEIAEFLTVWNEKYPDKKSSYPALCKARIKYKQFGEDALLSKKGFREEYRVKPEYYEYYKKLYLNPKAPSAIDCWTQTLNYAKHKDKIKTANFPCDKTFDRLLKKEFSSDEIKRARRYREKVIASDYSNIVANEYWIVESYQLNFPIRFKKRHFYPWLTVVKDVKTAKWLGWFVFHEAINSGHILQAIYYAVIKYGSPRKMFIKITHFDSYTAMTGKIKKAKIDCNKQELIKILIYSGASYDFNVPINVNAKSIRYDLREFEGVVQDTDIFEFKRILDYHIEMVVNERKLRNKLYQQKSSNQLWQENYTQQEVPNKADLIDMCLISRNPLKFGKNGIHDSVTNKHYWGDWMPLSTSSSMYLRRDIYSEDDGCLYDGDNQRLLGYAYVLKPVPALWKTPEERELLRLDMERKKRAFNNAKSFIKDLNEIPLEEIYENYEAAYRNEELEMRIKNAPKPVTRILRTRMDEVARITKEQEEAKILRDKFYHELYENTKNDKN